MKAKHSTMALAVFIVTVGCSGLTTWLDLPAWPIFIGWSLFYLIGANKESVKANLPSLVGGAVLASLTGSLLNYLALGLIPNAIVVGCMAALAILLQETIWFKMVSMVFIGINMYFALGSILFGVILPALGFVMGLATNQLIILINNNKGKQ